jgi:hypothetical protein
MKAVLWCWSAAALSAVACTTAPVQGSIDGLTDRETFTGTARGSVVDKSGNPTSATNAGLTCSGRFVYLTEQDVRGTFNCGSGQSGPFELTRTGDRWAGTGIIGNRRVALELGHL